MHSTAYRAWYTRPMKGKGITIFWIVLAVLIVGGFGWTMYAKTLPGKYDGLAQCLKDKGAVFYGAFWCPHCQEQKKMFGNSAKLLPYVECSTPDGKNQTQICIDKGVQSYPTWEFADGSKLTGEQQPQILAEKAGCEMPQ
jgi:thiol-disulfide isomerase/thioredoxin